MTLQIAIVLVVLIVAVVLFITERLRMDLVALLVLGTLAVTGVVTPTEALSGFSNPAVVTVWAVFILSGSLSRTGVANSIGQQVLRWAGTGEMRLIVVIMLTAATLSAFMNNVGVVALLLPVVMSIAKRTRRPPSRLLMPLAFASLLGGLTTLIGTPPNILVSDALRNSGLPPFRFFDFTPTGLAVMLAGIAFMTLVGRHLLPHRDPAGEFADSHQTNLDQVYGLSQRISVVRLPAQSALAGKTLAESRLGSALGLNLIGIIRNGQTQLLLHPQTVLQDGDRLLVTGQLDQLGELLGQQQLVMEDDALTVEHLAARQIQVAEITLSPRSALLGKSLTQIDFRRTYDVTVLAIWRDGVAHRTHLQHIPLELGDTLLVHGTRAQLDQLRNTADFLVSSPEVAQVYSLHERLLVVRVPEASTLVGKTLAQSRLGDAFGLTVVGIVRQDKSEVVPSSTTQLMAGDTLMVEGRQEDLLALQGLQHLEIDEASPVSLPALESDDVRFVEATLSPHTTLAGQTLRQLHFREKYGLNVLAILREGKTHHDALAEMTLRFGDALLLYGPTEKIRVLGSEPDFLVLTEVDQEIPRLNKAPVALLIMASVVLSVILGWWPISIAAVVGASLVVLTGCVTMEEAYRYIEWKAVFLIAGMLPLGIAMQQTGAAQFLAGGVVSGVGGFGPLAVVAALFILTTLAAQVMPTAAVAVLLAPIALDMAVDLGMSPYALMMTVAMSASASFLSPVAHPANVLTMGPGGYRFTDYIRVGLPLTLTVLAVVLLVLPIFWPLY